MNFMSFYVNISNFELESDQLQEVEITHTPSQTGVVYDTLYIISNDPDENIYYIILQANVTNPPVISVSPEYFDITLEPGETVSHILSIYNNGESDLNFSTNFDEYSGAGMAASFDGINDYLSIAEPVISFEYFTIEFWVKMSGPGGGVDNVNAIFEQRDDTPQDNCSAIVIYTENSLDQAKYLVRSSNGNGQPLITESYNYNEWHHYAGVTSQNSLFFYVDGEIVDFTQNNQSGDYLTSIDHIDFGRHRYWNETSGLLNGQIDEIRIWDYPRSTEQLIHSMNKSLNGNEPGLSSYWDFNDDDPWTDLSGNGASLNPHGGVSTVESTAPINNWLSVNYISNVVPENSYEELNLTFDSSDLDAGSYNMNLIISSNDPACPEVVVPITLEIIADTVDDVDHDIMTNLIGNFPNPFSINRSDDMKILFSLTSKTQVTIDIYNLKGQKVKSLINDRFKAGLNEVSWNGEDNEGNLVYSGIYFYKMKTDEYTEIKKMIIIH